MFSGFYLDFFMYYQQLISSSFSPYVHVLYLHFYMSIGRLISSLFPCISFCFVFLIKTWMQKNYFRLRLLRIMFIAYLHYIQLQRNYFRFLKQFLQIACNKNKSSMVKKIPLDCQTSGPMQISLSKYHSGCQMRLCQCQLYSKLIVV